jgi:hypothetical protein
MKFFVVLILFCAGNAYAFELVCKGQDLRNPQQRPVYINCDNKEAILGTLDRVSDFLKKNNASYVQQQNCTNVYKQFSTIASAETSALAKGGFLQMCSEGLKDYK